MPLGKLTFLQSNALSLSYTPKLTFLSLSFLIYEMGITVPILVVSRGCWEDETRNSMWSPGTVWTQGLSKCHPFL